MPQHLRYQNLTQSINVAKAPWPHWRGFYLNSNGESPYEGPISSGLKWRYPTSNSVSSSPVIDNEGNVYFGSGSYLYACTSSGLLKWSFRAGGQVTGSAAVDSNRVVYFGSYDLNFYAVNTTTGIKICRNFFISFYSDFLNPLSIGILIQKSRLIQIIRSSPAIGTDGTIYLDVSYVMYAFHPINLIPKWNYSFAAGSGPVPFSNSLTVTDTGIIYVGTTSSGVLSVQDEGTSARLLWSMGPSSITTSPALTSNNQVLVGSSDSRLYSLNASTGDILWWYQTGM